MLSKALLGLALAAAPLPMARADDMGGKIVEAGNTLVSAMMMFVGKTSKVYILDKVEGNAEQLNGHSLYASVWDLESKTATPMDVQTNPFCANGMHLPNGSFVVFGGNNAVGPGGDNHITGSTQAYDPTYQDYGGTKAIRVITPCDGDINSDSGCAWVDSPNGLQMQSSRWYPGAEALGNGSVIIIGGFSSGGYINRNYPNKDPFYSGGGSNPTYELYPANGVTERVMQFMGTTSGLNSYPLTYLLSSGKLFVQANYSTILWDADNNIETPLQDMPNQIVRVYPASGANAMMPLTVANNYEQTVLFCGGFFMTDEQWGDFTYPYINTWEQASSADCQRMTPEPADGSTPAYEQDDDMPTTRTMGQFILLPDGKMLVVNGGRNGTAGYGTATNVTAQADMPWGESFAAEPQGQPAIYDPTAVKGSRWSTDGLATSNIPRLYHSSALLLPDGSVMIAGSNPNIDANLTAPFPTTYKAEYFYPPYFSASTRPVPSGIPDKLTYGGNYWNVTVPASSYSGDANDAANATKIWISRPGWTTHAMNMGQRMLQLNNTYAVSSDGTITYMVSQLPPNANLFQPGPAYVWVTIDGIPSNGTYVTVGSGNIEAQPTSDASVLPASVRAEGASGTASGNGNSNGSGSNGNTSSDSSSGSTSHTGAIVGGVVGAVAVIGVLGAVIGICLSRKRRAAARTANPGMGEKYAMDAMATPRPGYAQTPYGSADRDSNATAFEPLAQGDYGSSAKLVGGDGRAPSPYRDDYDLSRAGSPSAGYDPYHGQTHGASNLNPNRYQ